MERAPHRVALVVDAEYAERVIGLARECHSWVVRSPSNDPVIAAFWASEPAQSLDKGITAFDAAETREASLLSILDAVELHHGEYSHDPPLSIIEVIGVEPSPAITAQFASYGFQRIEPSANGFVARRESV